MAAFERINGYANNFTTGTLRSTADLKAFRIDIRDTVGNAVDLQAQDGDSTSEADQLVEQVIKELNPLMYHIDSAASGNVHVIMHGHAVDAASIKARLVGMASGSANIGSATVVTLGANIAVS